MLILPQQSPKFKMSGPTVHSLYCDQGRLRVKVVIPSVRVRDRAGLSGLGLGLVCELIGRRFGLRLGFGLGSVIVDFRPLFKA